jgi:hypothetical protein
MLKHLDYFMRYGFFRGVERGMAWFDRHPKVKLVAETGLFLILLPFLLPFFILGLFVE